MKNNNSNLLTGYKERGLFQTTAFKIYNCPYYVFFIKNEDQWDIIFKSKDKKYREWYYCSHGYYTITYNVDGNHKAYLSLKYDESKIQRVRKDKLYNSKFLITESGNTINRYINKLYYRPVIDNYYTTTITNRKRITVSVHRLVAHAFCPKPEHLKDVPYEDLMINHKDGVKGNNYYTNLEWCTNQENVKHAFDTGLSIGLKGEDSSCSKLTNGQVSEIRSHFLENPKTSYSWYSKKYNVSITIIHRILMNNTYNDNNYSPIDKERKMSQAEADSIRAHKINNPNTLTAYYSNLYNVSDSTIQKIFLNLLYTNKEIGVIENKNSKYKLNMDIAKQIREHKKANPKNSIASYARQYGVDPSSIDSLLKNKSYYDPDYVTVDSSNPLIVLNKEAKEWIFKHKHDNPDTPLRFYAEKYECTPTAVYHILKK
jgi:hypothetical protein